MIHLIEAGRSYKVRGLKGDLSVELYPQYRKHILNSGVLFFKLEGNAVPFFIDSVNGEDELFIKFKEVNSPESARVLSNQMIFIDDNHLIPEKIKADEYMEINNSLINYHIEDLESGFKGIIKDVEDFPGQIMAWVISDSKELMIPIHEDWIDSIDEIKKIIRVRLPQGLLEL